MMSELLSHGETTHGDLSTHLICTKVQTNISLLLKTMLLWAKSGKLILSLCQAGEIANLPTINKQENKHRLVPALEHKQVYYWHDIKTSVFQPTHYQMHLWHMCNYPGKEFQHISPCWEQNTKPVYLKATLNIGPRAVAGAANKQNVYEEPFNEFFTQMYL